MPRFPAGRDGLVKLFQGTKICRSRLAQSSGTRLYMEAIINGFTWRRLLTCNCFRLSRHGVGWVDPKSEAAAAPSRAQTLSVSLRIQALRDLDDLDNRIRQCESPCQPASSTAWTRQRCRHCCGRQSTDHKPSCRLPGRLHSNSGAFIQLGAFWDRRRSGAQPRPCCATSITRRAVLSSFLTARFYSVSGHLSICRYLGIRSSRIGVPSPFHRLFPLRQN